jgi:hypothetical protein
VKDDFAVFDGAALLLATECSDVASASGLLRAIEFADDVVGAFAAGGIAGLLIHARQRREIVSERVARDGIALPSAVDVSLGWKTRVLEEVM